MRTLWLPMLLLPQSLSRFPIQCRRIDVCVLCVYNNMASRVYTLNNYPERLIIIYFSFFWFFFFFIYTRINSFCPIAQQKRTRIDDVVYGLAPERKPRVVTMTATVYMPVQQVHVHTYSRISVQLIVVVKSFLQNILL